MRLLFALGIACCGCLTLSVHGSTNVAVTDAPVRRLAGGVELGAFINENDIVANFFVGGEAGPLGARSEPQGEWGFRVVSSSHGNVPGVYVMSAYNAKTFGGADPGIHVTVGGAFARVNGPSLWPTSWHAFAFGISYHHEQQAELGAGSFLGIELVLIGGYNFLKPIGRWLEHLPDKHR